MRFRFLNLMTVFLTLVFIIFSCEKPYKAATIKTGAATGIEINEAQVSGTIIDLGSGITQYGHCWSKGSAPTISSHITELGANAKPGSFNSLLTGLEPGKKYTYRSYALKGDNVTYGNLKSFSTLTGLAKINSLEASGVSTVSAICGGEVLSANGAVIISRGVCWSTSAYPSIVNNKILIGDGIGIFSSTIEGLTINTQYYASAYAETDFGISYGEQVMFHTLDGLPDVVTDSVSAITETSAVCGGNIISDDGFEVTSRGLVWSTSSKPTVESNDGITTNGSGLGVFSTEIGDLTDQTTYYLRAYAINSYGISYGKEMVFIAEGPRSGHFIDSRDLNRYRWVRIGNQVWMAENLAFLPAVGRYTSYNVYGYFGNDVNIAKGTSNYNTYGVLYDWQAAMESCPDGWHLPSDDEWKQLAIFLGVSEEEANDVGLCGVYEGGKLKETGTAHWLGTNSEATNESGFTALPGGTYNRSGYYNSYYEVFEHMGFRGYWWTSTLAEEGIWIRKLDFYFNGIHRYTSSELGLSVRCLKDE